MRADAEPRSCGVLWCFWGWAACGEKQDWGHLLGMPLDLFSEGEGDVFCFYGAVIFNYLMIHTDVNACTVFNAVPPT